MSKYAPLTHHLAAQRAERVPMRFSEIEALLGTSLPASAWNHRPWWANSGHGHTQSRGWIEAGYQTEEVDLAAGRLVFVRLNAADDGRKPSEPPAGSGRHPLIGCMAGTITLAPGTDLTEPTAPDWETETLTKFDRLLGSGSE